MTDDLTAISGIGKTFARDFAHLVIWAQQDRVGKTVEDLFEQMVVANEREHHKTSKNYLYVIRMAIYLPHQLFLRQPQGAGVRSHRSPLPQPPHPAHPLYSRQGYTESPKYLVKSLTPNAGSNAGAWPRQSPPLPLHTGHGRP